MPWCPRCDEVFPEGPTCPRCRSSLVDVGVEAPSGSGPPGGSLPQVEVPRRLRRAFDRMGRRPTPPRHLIAFAMACLLFAGGFLVGRMSSLAPEGPALRELSSGPVDLPLDGVVSYVAPVPGPTLEPVLVRHDLPSGRIDHAGRFSLPGGTAPASVTSRVVNHGQNVAVVLSDPDGLDVVGAFPRGRRLPVWVDGIDAAWESGTSLLVGADDGGLVRWSFSDGVDSEPVPGRWTRILSVPGGAVLERADDGRRSLWTSTPQGLREVMSLPADARLLAGGSGAEVALLEVDGGIALWNGDELTEVRADGREVTGAAFSPDGEAVAMALVERGRPEGSTPVHLGISDQSGNIAFHPVTTWPERQSCDATPAWDADGLWVYLSPGDGAVYAIEAGGARTRGASTRTLGCGVAWLD